MPQNNAKIFKRHVKEHPLDYGQFLGEDYQWVLCEAWREVIVKPTSKEE